MINFLTEFKRKAINGELHPPKRVIQSGEIRSLEGTEAEWEIYLEAHSRSEMALSLYFHS